MGPKMCRGSAIKKKIAKERGEGCENGSSLRNKKTLEYPQAELGLSHVTHVRFGHTVIRSNNSAKGATCCNFGGLRTSLICW